MREGGVGLLVHPDGVGRAGGVHELFGVGGHVGSGCCREAAGGEKGVSGEVGAEGKRLCVSFMVVKRI